MHTAPLTIELLNRACAQQCIGLLDGLYEHSPWVVERGLSLRPYASLAHLKQVLVKIVREATPDEQLALLQAHPELAGKAMQANSLTAESTNEQRKAGLVDCTSEELDRLQELNRQYLSRFGFPFILAVRGPRGQGLSKVEIIQTFERRLLCQPDAERAEALRNVDRIAEIRLNEKFGFEPTLGNQVWDWAQHLALDSDPGFAERGELTVTYLTDAHRACAKRLCTWMQECGFDTVSIDAVGNVVGIYYGLDSNSRRLLTGSHYDTVRNGGKYDGRLGILVPMACVQQLRRANRRLPYGIEVVGFSEEEGQRFNASFLGSGALTGDFDNSWLDQKDADGITMRQAMEHAGLCIEDIASLARDPEQYLGFVEAHIEQGPVLCDADLPLGVVTSINGSLRYTGVVTGVASHAGTTPMHSRRDAAMAVAEWMVYVETRAASQADVVATVGALEVINGSVNVVPGQCHFSLDIRATSDASRDRCAQDVITKLNRVCELRGVDVSLEQTMCASAAPCAPDWQSRWERAIEQLGLPALRIPSGAGHDAMKLHQIMPQAMLFVRGLNSGISHNPLESVTADDAELCALAFTNLLNDLATELQ